MSSYPNPIDGPCECPHCVYCEEWKNRILEEQMMQQEAEQQAEDDARQAQYLYEQEQQERAD